VNDSMFFVVLDLGTSFTIKSGEVILSNPYKKRSRSVTLICSKRMVNRLNVPPIVPIALNFRFILDNCVLYFSSSYNMISINVNVLNFMRKEFIWYLSMSIHFMWAGFLQLGFIISSFSVIAR